MNKLTFVGLAMLLLAAIPFRAAAAEAESAMQQAPSQITVSGTVSDGTGAPLVAVTVVNLDTGMGVITNSDGRYTITASPSSTLRFSFLGYSTVEESIGGRTTINVTLEDEVTSIDDVIIIGYGTTTRRRATGAVDQVTASVIQDRPVANAKQALQGLSPSLVI
ncbi:MAG: carboxypeptidase-like regulatory domain-containing protein [Alistipes sp.]|nr:carboxypeptidase-like regulatory domain-containing protein [Alistipes sp.]